MSLTFYNWRVWGLIAGGLVVVQAGVLYMLGQPIICTCGYIKLWEGNILSSGMSQHLTDWYTFSHIIHGFIFYAILRYFFPRTSVVQRLVMSMGFEIAWEITENTPIVIQHYRQQALAAGYTGDSILNSISDTCSMILGFGFAYRMPILVTIVVALGFELGVAYAIRDNLTLNVINLIYPFQFIHHWQEISSGV